MIRKIIAMLHVHLLYFKQIILNIYVIGYIVRNCIILLATYCLGIIFDHLTQQGPQKLAFDSPLKD